MVHPITCITKKSADSTPDMRIIKGYSYIPEDTYAISEIEALYHHLVFALKYEGIHLLFFSQLVKHYSEDKLLELILIQPSGQYSRRIWFLIEWILGREISGRADIKKKSYIPLVNEKLQYAAEGQKSRRHLILNNLPGTASFCPMVRKTQKLEGFINDDMISEKIASYKGSQNQVLRRASSFLVLEDSKASFSIEGESSKSLRVSRWAKMIDQVGMSDLSIERLVELQKMAISKPTRIQMGLRQKGGFVGSHHRHSGEPLPEHISARWQDLDVLMNGLMDSYKLLTSSKMDPVIAAAVLSFGFVFIHPFLDGNGRVHRYLMQHVLHKMAYIDNLIKFPISASILKNLERYRTVLVNYSHPLLAHIDWEETADHNINVLNETIDLYRFYDATLQCEFLYECIYDTVETIIPEEIDYLIKYDAFKMQLSEEISMPDNEISLLLKLLAQNNAKLSKRAKEKIIKGLTEDQVSYIEEVYADIFVEDN